MRGKLGKPGTKTLLGITKKVGCQVSMIPFGFDQADVCFSSLVLLGGHSASSEFKVVEVLLKDLLRSWIRANGGSCEMLGKAR